jgi:hypothetical protein
MSGRVLGGRGGAARASLCCQLHCALSFIPPDPCVLYHAQVSTDKAQYAANDLVTLRFLNPLSNAVAMTVVGSPSRSGAVIAPVVTFTSLPVASGPATLTLPITPRSCGANCVVTVVLTTHTAQVCKRTCFFIGRLYRY